MSGAGLGLIQQAVGSGVLQVRPECGSMGPAREHITLGCPSNVLAPGETRLGAKASANATCLAALMIALICNIIFQSVNHKWNELWEGCFLSQISVNSH